MTRKEKELLNEMLGAIQRIKDQTDYINKEERIPQLELDAIVARIEKLHELSVALKYFHAYIDEIVEEKQQIISEKNAVVDEVHSVNKYVIEPIDTVKESIEDKETSINMDSLVQELSQVSFESANEKHSGGDDESVANKLMLQPLSDLRSGIGINDKFQFINELFGGDSETFNSKIEMLNDASNMVEAKSLLLEYSWDESNEVVKSFLTLLERRYL